MVLSWRGSGLGFLSTAGYLYLVVNSLTFPLCLLISPELSASDDSSLSDGLLLEEGEED